MGFGFQGLKNASSSVANILASLVGQDIVARSISLTQVAGSTAIQLVTGARLKFGTNANDYASSDGSTVTFAQSLAAVDFTMTGNSGQVYFSSASALAAFITNISAANAGATAATAAFKIYPLNALDATDWVLSLGTASNAASLFAVTYGGGVVLPTTDSSGTPGNATINQAVGRSAIALGAATVTISNTLVTANSRILICQRARDATGLLPMVSAQVAGTSFTVTVTANCTAALPFDWFVFS